MNDVREVGLNKGTRNKNGNRRKKSKNDSKKATSGKKKKKRRERERGKKIRRVSQKVVNHRTLAILILLRLLFAPMDIIFRRGVKNIEISFACVTHLQDTSQVSAPIAVIRCTPDRTESVIVENLISLLAQLVGP